MTGVCSAASFAAASSGDRAGRRARRGDRSVVRRLGLLEVAGDYLDYALALIHHNIQNEIHACDSGGMDHFQAYRILPNRGQIIHDFDHPRMVSFYGLLSDNAWQYGLSATGEPCEIMRHDDTDRDKKIRIIHNTIQPEIISRR